MILTIKGSVPPELHPHQRWAWRPITVQVKPGKDNPYDSKFGGTPYLLADEQHPRCQNCQQSMQLFLQLQLGRIPEELKKHFPNYGVLQLFYCTNQETECELKCKGWDAFSTCSLTRIIPVGHHSQPKPEMVRDALPVSIISRWKKLPDYPTYLEAKAKGLKIDDIIWEQIANEDITQCLDDDKLWGWPAWITNVSYPPCPICRKPMRHLFQIASQINLTYTFGEHGRGYITQCAKHKDQLSFSWDC